MFTKTEIFRPVLVAAGLLAATLACFDPSTGDQSIDFVRDVEPILRESCYECHGPDEQEGGLRWDARVEALVGGDSGPAFEPGNSAESLLIELVTVSDEEERMPQDGDPLSGEQIAILRAWIDEGADWPEGVGAVIDDRRSHWAYVKPVRPELPEVDHSRWPRNGIDRFVLARMETAGLSPAPRAERAQLLRRVYLDLIGLPPSIEEVDDFLADNSPNAYEKAVDRLLQSPHYGERWAVPWLDAGRYADSHGFQEDNLRESWSYRDWVIDALNVDMPFDQFSIEQIAGDLLPDATIEQKVATGFHRNVPTNIEAGVNPEEDRVNQVIDRVNVTGSVWLGSTIACAQCHSHKYDPFSQREYYQLFSYFNNTPIETVLFPMNTARSGFIGPWLEIEVAPRPEEIKESKALSQPIMGTWFKVRKLREEVDPEFPAWKKKMERDLHSPELASPALPDSVRTALLRSAEGANLQKKEEEDLKNYFYNQHPQLKRLLERFEKLQARNKQLQPKKTHALVMIEDTPRDSYVLRRGNFLDRGEQVESGTPKVLHPMPETYPADRLGLARWLVSPENPLVARVTVNRAWAEFFGQGIVTTPEDFGTRGERPTHPLLLDWLAVDFMANGWSMKRLHKQIVMSATYRQGSELRPGVFEKDPLNQLYARGPRFRLAAEFVRDNALALSGLLDRTLHGPPTYPPQPEGLWRMTGDLQKAPYTVSEGKDRYRRGLYTIWRRSSPYPSLTNFDAPDRSASCVQRSRTNTVLQALTLLNDPAYIEAAVALARRIQAAPGRSSVSEKIRFGLRLALAREPTPVETQRLERLYREEVGHFRSDPQKARELLEPWGVDPAESTGELAAWVFVANVLLNLDETITKG